MRALALLLLLTSSAWAAYPTRGYVGRPCGFDLNRNGVVGEAADCTICGQSDGTLTVGANSWTQIYVDCSGAGASDSNPGTRASPKRTITGGSGAFSVSPAAGAARAVCVKGTCTAATGESFPMNPPQGQTGNYGRLPSTSARGNFQFPTEPTILSGWDANGDGNYPPNSGETATIAGTDASSGGVMNYPSYFEWAHLTFTTWANAASTDGTFAYMFSPGSAQYATFHDGRFTNFARRTASGIGGPGESMLFATYANGPGNLSWENLIIDNYSGHIWRGSTDVAAPGGPFLLRALSITGNPSVGNGSPFWFKPWGPYTGVDILDSVMDGNPAAWQSGNSPNGQWFGVDFPQCVQDVFFRNNKIINVPNAITMQPEAGSGFCNFRPVTPVVIDATEIVTDFPFDCYGAVGIKINSSSLASAYVGDVTISNSLIRTTGSGFMQSAMLLNPGVVGSSCADITGAVKIFNNTIDISMRRFCGGDLNPFGTIAYTAYDGNTSNCEQQNWDIRNNIVVNRVATGAATRNAIQFDSTVNSLLLNNNVYNDTNVAIGWAYGPSSATTLANWRTATGQEAQSKDCLPSLTADYHLNSGDTCARDSGTSVASVLGCTAGSTCFDFDRDVRPQ